jgi:hypothetical protein
MSVCVQENEEFCVQKTKKLCLNFLLDMHNLIIIFL